MAYNGRRLTKIRKEKSIYVNEYEKKHGTGAAVVLIVLCLLALGTLGYIIWRQFNPVVPETAAGYVAAAGTTAPVYDENGASWVPWSAVRRYSTLLRTPRTARTASAWSTARATPIWTRPT